MAGAYIESAPATFSCGAVEIGDFGGGEAWDPDDGGDEFGEGPSVEELVKGIKETLRSAKRRGYSVAFATTMSNQPNAKKALIEVGFYTAKPFKKTGNTGDNRKMQAWFIPLIEVK